MNTPRALAPYVLRALAASQRAGKATNLQRLTDELGVRRSDIRATINALHDQGLLDALTMRLSLHGFAIGSALRSQKLRPLREVMTSSAMLRPAIVAA